MRFFDKVFSFFILIVFVVPAYGESHEGDDALRRLLRDIERIDLEQRVARVPLTPLLPQQLSSQKLATYRVKPGDTLDIIINKVMPETSVRGDFLKKAFVRANPHAFRRSNPNWLYAGVKLKIPTADDFRKVVFKQDPNKMQKSNHGRKRGFVTFP